MSQLTVFITPLLNTLHDLEQPLVSLAAFWRNTENSINRQVEGLLQSDVSIPFAGKGATAFQEAMQRTEDLAEMSMQAPDVAIQATQACQDSIDLATESVESAGMNDRIMYQYVLNLTLDDVVQRGGMAIDDATRSVGQWAINGLNGGDPDVISNIDGGVNLYLYVQTTGQMLSGDGIQYLGNVPQVLSTWAADVSSAVQQWQRTFSEITQDIGRTNSSAQQSLSAFTAKASGIDWGFIEKREGDKTTGYIPLLGHTGTKSGVTIGRGFDIGQYNVADFDKLNLPEPEKSELRAKFMPYFGLKQWDADAALQAHGPLEISPQECQDLDEAVRQKFEHDLIQTYNKHSSVPFQQIPPAAQTAIMSVYYQYGHIPPKFGEQIYQQNWAGAESELRYGAWATPARRILEANYLHEHIPPVAAPPSAEAGYTGITPDGAPYTGIGSMPPVADDPPDE